MSVTKLIAKAGLTAGVIAMSVSGCSSLSKAVGSGKNSPDEFAVVTKAPLVIPPDFSLRPPKPGARRPQESNASDAAANAIFGKGGSVHSNTMSDGERVLLTAAGADGVDNSIRDLVDSEYFTIQRTDSGFANKILFWQGEGEDE